MFGEIQL